MDAPSVVSKIATCDRILFATESIRIGAFRCHRDDPAFHDSGPATSCCFVFPRTAVEIQHEHQSAFVANPNIVTFYNRGQAYLRNPVSPEGDRCDWFGVHDDIVRDAVRHFDPAVDSRPEHPFRSTRCSSDSSTYLSQRRAFERVAAGIDGDPLAIEEAVIQLLDRVIASAYRTRLPIGRRPLPQRGRETIHYVECLLSTRWDEPLTLQQIATKAGMSMYHLSRLFRQVTGSTLHRYRERLRLRAALEGIRDSTRPLVDIALDGGFSSHSHFTSAFHREFRATPSGVRLQFRAKS